MSPSRGRANDTRSTRDGDNKPRLTMLHVSCVMFEESGVSFPSDRRINNREREALAEVSQQFLDWTILARCTRNDVDGTVRWVTAGDPDLDQTNRKRALQVWGGTGIAIWRGCFAKKAGSTTHRLMLITPSRTQAIARTTWVMRRRSRLRFGTSRADFRRRSLRLCARPTFLTTLGLRGM